MPTQLGAGERGLEIRDLRKRFGNTQALAGIDLVIPAGRVTGIAGPNGAGKSTLVRILAGEAGADEGTMLLDGASWSPTEGTNVAIVHQEPQLFPNLTVAQNLLVGRERTRTAWPRPGEHESGLLRQLELWDYRERALANCSLAIQQRTEIARAVGANARLFLFDEPNSALSRAESTDLFRFLRQLASDGRVVVLVSHRLAELVAHCDSVCIIRDGRVTSELSGANLSSEAIAQHLVAGHVGSGSDSPELKIAAAAEPVPVLQLRNWTHAKHTFTAVDLAVMAGEVTAVVGVEGSGARELVRSMAGLERASGQANSHPGLPTTELSVEYVGPDRREALFYNLSLAENVAVRLTDSRIVSRFGMLRRSGVREVGNQWVLRFHIRSESVDQPVGSLSGGNQQKVALAAAIACDPEMLVLEEPTRGVDVGSKRDIHQMLNDFALAGHGVLIYSTEIVEAYEAADRIYVMVGGRLAGPLEVRDFADVESLASRVSSLESEA